MSDALDALFPTEGPATEAPVEAIEAKVEVAAPEPIVQEPAPEAQPAPVQQQEHFVPLPKYLDTRDELKEARRRIAEFEASKPQVQRPDPLDDPDGFRASLQSDFDTKLSEQRFQMSDVMARQVHGAETVEQAVQWAQEKAQADPMFAASYMRDANPIDWIVRQHKQQALVAQLPTDISSIDELIEREIAKRGLIAPAAVAEPLVPAAAQQAPKPAVPPRSLVSAPAAGGGAGHVPVGTTAAMEAIFPR